MKTLSLRLARISEMDILLKLKKENYCYHFNVLEPSIGFSEDKERKMIEEAIEGAEDVKGIYVIETSNNEIIASCSILRVLYRNGHACLRFDPRRDLEQEVKEKCLQMFLELYFLELNYYKLNLYIRGSADKEKAFYLRMLFQEEVVLREHYYVNGCYESIYQLGLTKKEYKQKQVIPLEKPPVVPTRVEDTDYELTSILSPKQQLLVGKKINLETITKTYAQKLYELSVFSDASNMAAISAVAPHHLETIVSMAEHKNDYYSFKGRLEFAIVTKEGEVVGTISGQMVDLRNRNIMIGITIYHASHRGKGYGGEAIRLFTDFAFLEMNMHRVYLGGFSFNEEALGLYAHLGFKKEGVNRSFVYRNGNYYDEQVLGVLRQEWLLLRGYLK